MKRRPNKVKILGVPYKIVYVTSLAETPNVGDVDLDEAIITIYDNGNDEQVFATLLHEILHAINYTLHLDALNEAKNKKSDEETDCFASALGDLLLSNKWITIRKERGKGDANQN